MQRLVRPLWRGRALALTGIVLFAFSLRSAVASLSPVVDHIAADFPLAPTVLGLIGTAPPACYAVFGILTPMLERRFGLEPLAAAAMVAAAVGMAARGFANDGIGLLLATALVFAAVGVGNILLPPLAKRYFPDRLGVITTFYSMTMTFATAVPALVAVPIADAAGWRMSLAMWAGFALVAVLPWLALGARRRSASVEVEQASPRVLSRMPRLPMAWALALSFAASSTLAYTMFAWLPVLLLDTAGVSPATAGVLLSLFALIAVPCALLVPTLVVRRQAARAVFGVAIAAGLAGVAGLLLAPGVLTWLWVVLYGVTGALFPLCLVLLGVRARTHEGAVALSGFVQSIGYAIAAVFPVGIGLVHELTGSWQAPLLIVAGVLVAAIPAGVIASRPHSVEDEWQRRHGAW